VIADLATWSGSDGFGSGGFGLALLFVGAPALLFVAARAWRRSARLAVVVAMLAAVAIRSVVHPTPGTTLAGLALLLGFALALRAPRAFVPEAIASALSAIGALPSRIGAAVAGASRLAARTRIGRVSVLPVVVPVALCAVFAGIFALANPVVARAAGVLWQAIVSLGLPSPGRVAMFAFALVGAVALLRPSIYKTKLAEAAPACGDARETTLAVARNALVGLNVLFLAYDALDAAYLWSGRPPAGMTTQAYAHQGAFWLTIALVLLTLVVGVMFKGPIAHDPRGRLARGLAYAWMAQGLVVAVGTYRRIAIHVAHSGLSDLRIVGVLGTTLVVFGVVLVARKLRARRTFTWLVRRQLDALAVAFVVYAVFPTNWVSARVNVSRIEAGEYRPLLHMFRQARRAESAPTLLPLLRHQDHRVRQGVAALLEQERADLHEEASSETTWRERDLVTPRALASLDAAAPEIQAALGDVDRSAARQVLLEISRVANEDRSLEDLLAIPDAETWSRDGSVRREY
jgi:hypothetical protein